jgi:thiamine-phosphate pyrophosphorylase
MVDLRVYAIVDPERNGGFALDDLAARVAAGGATLVQLRDKKGETRRLVEEARAIKQALSTSAVTLVINDRVDVALAAEAHGVHLGQDDMAVADARLLLGTGAIIGLSIKSAAQAAAAPLDMLDYVAIGGVYPTSSKDNTDPPIGTGGLRTVVAAVRAGQSNFPIAAIAGIDRTNAADVVAAGADGVAVISALSMTPDPTAAARELRAVVDAALAKRRTA